MKVVAFVAAGAVAVLAGCTSAGTAPARSSAEPTVAPGPISTPTSSAPATFLASRTETGGMCPNGECESTFAVSSDGAWYLVSSTMNRSGWLAPATVASLTSAVTSTSILSAPAFTGTCPIAYDGSEVIYSWRDGSGTTQTVSACDKAVSDDDPLVVALAQAQAEAGTGSTAAPTDDMAALGRRTVAIAQTVVGMTEADAAGTLASVSSVPITTRVVSRDGVALPVTEDYSPTRVNLTLVDGRVTAVSVG